METASVEFESMEAKVKMVKSIVGSEISEADVLKALSLSNNNVREAVDIVLDSPASCSSHPHLTAHKTVTSTGGTRIQVNQSNNLGDGVDDSVRGLNVVKQEFLSVENGEGAGSLEGEREGGVVERCDVGIGSMEMVRVKEEIDVGFGSMEIVSVKEEIDAEFSAEENREFLSGETRVKEEPNVDIHDSFDAVNQESRGVESGEVAVPKDGEREGSLLIGAGEMEVINVKQEKYVNFEGEEGGGERALVLKSPERKEEAEDELSSSAKPVIQVKENPRVDTVVEEEVTSRMKVGSSLNADNKGMIVVKEGAKQLTSVQPLSARKLSDDEYNKRMQVGCNNPKPKRARADEMALSSVLIEDGDFEEEPGWLLVGRTVVTGLSTTKGRKLENNEIVHFAFPSSSTKTKITTHFMSSKAAQASSSIVRFSTKRNGEIGRLPMEWAKCLIPLVNSSKVKVLGRCVAAPVTLHTMQEILLYVSFYIHESVFSEVDKSWKLEATNIDATIYPLLKLFKLLKVNPSQKAQFTPEELDSRKRSLKLDDETVSALPSLKRIKGSQGQDHKVHEKDEQVISESTLNRLVGAVDMYNLEEMEPSDTLACVLRPYQKQALYWMSELEKGANHEEEETKTLHPCWAAYRVCDERAPVIYVNQFSGEATTEFPTATQMARGGILADAMGLGKTVMTIALILSRRGHGIPDDQQAILNCSEDINNRQRSSNSLRKPKGGTLIVCPMALLSQWKDELEAHSKPDSITVFIHYGGDRTSDPKMIAEPDVVLTTYGVLTSAYRSDGVNSIYHRVQWHRVVLDEAHTIKSSKSQAAQAAFALSSYCRWCLTGTPLQNNLEDLFSLLCFLHVEPWCNWAWWNKLIQKPYDNGDMRGLQLVKAILRPLMLRRTKESKDKNGRLILVLPPTDIQVTECEQSEAEQDFYDALFKRSKVQFDQFVAQGKVLHNFANILELLLRLRQCCNHPFLVMSRGDTAEYADLNKLARKFLQSNSDAGTGPSRAYVEEVVEGIRNGENTECPICLESADDPVLTPCAHRMCRECLLSSWRTPAGGLCPICRILVVKSDLITCPSASKFRVDVHKNWKESSKVSKLLECLEDIRSSGSGEKSIVFSQWTSFLDLLEIPLKKRNFGFLRFDGKLAQKQRAKVLHEFAETTEKTVLLMSLKAGGVGLNLTAASNVFLMDPWWNPAVEEQAIMRIHRIGQKRTVRVRRFIVKDTVEERLQQVQARKQRMIAGALTDEEVRSARLEELKMLFR